MYAYHIDRTSSDLYRPGDNLTASPVFTKYEETDSLLNEAFNNKLTRHGQQYLTNPVNPNSPWDNFYETIFEYERKIKFPNLPSRYQSFFAIETLDDLELWKDILKLQGNEHIWKIHVNEKNVLKTDASWFNIKDFDQSVLRISYNASQYWLGKKRPNHNHESELLIKGSIKLVERLD